MDEKRYTDFEELFRFHHRELTDFAYNLVRDRDSAKDIVQEVFMKLWGNRDRIDFGPQIKHYLFKATAHTAYNVLRANKIRITIDADPGLLRIESSKGYHDTEFTELDNKVRSAIDRLPPKCRTIYILSRHEEMKYKEIADALGLSVKTVENQMGIALQKLRDELKEYLIIPILAIVLLLSGYFFLFF